MHPHRMFIMLDDNFFDIPTTQNGLVRYRKYKFSYFGIHSVTEYHFISGSTKNVHFFWKNIDYFQTYNRILVSFSVIIIWNILIPISSFFVSTEQMIIFLNQFVLRGLDFFHINLPFFYLTILKFLFLSCTNVYKPDKALH